MFARQAALAASVITAAILAGGSAAAAAPAATAWPVTHGDEPDTCMAIGPVDGETHLFLVLEAGAYAFFTLGPDMPKMQGEVPVTIAFDKRAPTPDQGFAVNGGAMFLLGVDSAVRTTLAADTVRLEVGGRTHAFPLAGAGASLDALAACAGQPPLGR